MKPVLAYHVIFGAYGFWLPNDPRGSWSEFVSSWELRAFGPATKTDIRRSVAGRPHDRQLRLAAKRSLQRTAVKFTGIQARAIGNGFGRYINTSSLNVWACSIMPEHVHMVVGRAHITIEQIVVQLKAAATARLVEEEMHPFPPQPGERPEKCWSRGEWSVFLDDPADILRCVRYVENNPVKEGKPRQNWNFVKPYTPRVAATRSADVARSAPKTPRRGYAVQWAPAVQVQ